MIRIYRAVKQFAVLLFYRANAPHYGTRGVGAVAKDYAKAFYLSEAWQRTRKAYYISKCGLCERCGAPGDIVHHRRYITPQNIHDPHITLDFRNLELLCIDCHNKEHSGKPTRYSFDKSGNIIPPTLPENTPKKETGDWT